MRRSPLHDLLQAAGAVFEVRSGWFVATSIGTKADDAVSVLTIADESAHGKLMVEGDGAANMISTALQVHAPTVGLSSRSEAGQVYSLRRNLFFIATSPGLETGLVERLRATDVVQSGLVTITDVTAGRAQIRITGSVCRLFLPKLSALDFTETSFPDGSAQISSLARTTQLIVRADQGGALSFLVVGGRSLGAYMWGIMLQAGREWGITPVLSADD